MNVKGQIETVDRVVKIVNDCGDMAKEDYLPAVFFLKCLLDNNINLAKETIDNIKNMLPSPPPSLEKFIKDKIKND